MKRVRLSRFVDRNSHIINIAIAIQVEVVDIVGWVLMSFRNSSSDPALLEHFFWRAPAWLKLSRADR